MKSFATEHFCCLIHNHPSNSSLSQSDWNVLSKFPKMTMVAINSQGSTFRGKVEPECFSDWTKEINDNYHKIEIEMEIAIDNDLTSLSIDSDKDDSGILLEISWFIGVHIGCTLLKKGYVDYEFVLKGKDYSLWHQEKNKAIHKNLECLCDSITP